MNGYAAIRQKKSWCFGEWLPSLKLTAPANHGWKTISLPMALFCAGDVFVHGFFSGLIFPGLNIATNQVHPVEP